MKKNKLLKKGEHIVRILAEEGNDVLYIPCRRINSSMPRWCSVSDFEDYNPCIEEELLELHDINIVTEEELEPGERNDARQRYTIIAPVLGCLEDEKIRAQMIERTAKEHGITKQTVRNYLKMYLTYNSISALVRKHRTTKEKPVTEDEKNIRWAVNKYVYSRKKHSLNTAYKLMLKEKYTDSNGVLAEGYPVIARKIYPKSTELACPSTDGYNDHKSIERKSIPIMMTRTTTPSEMLLNPKHGYYKTLFFGIQGKFRFFLCKEQGELLFTA